MSQVGDARRAVQDLCRALGTDAEFSGRAALVATELARNLVSHADTGCILLRAITGPESGIEILSLDQGPGIRDIAACLRDGYSTAGTPGNGFGAVQRLTQGFEIYSRLGQGTGIWCLLLRNQTVSRVPVVPRLLGGAVSVCMDREEVCGDDWEFQSRPEGGRILVVDGLGHGMFAHQAAVKAVDSFNRESRLDMVPLLQVMDEALAGTRGAAAMLVHVDLDKETVTCAGVGNIAARMIMEDGSTRSMISENGTLGTGVRRVRDYSYPWIKHAVLIVHTDGISANWNPAQYPGLFLKHPSLVAGILFRDHQRQRDDATITVFVQKN